MTEKLNRMHHALHGVLDVLAVLWGLSLLVYFFETPLHGLPSSLKYFLAGLHIAGCVLLVVRYPLLGLMRRNQLRHWEKLQTSEGFVTAAKNWYNNGLNLPVYSHAPLASHVFATRGTFFETYNVLNYRGFANTPFEVPRDRLEARNRELVARNPYCFLLVYDPLRHGIVIGFSCVLPLNEAGARAYLDGHLRDSDLREAYIAPPDREAEILVIFAFYLDEELRFPFGHATASYMLYVLEHVRWHVRFFHTSFAQSLPVYAQVARAGLGHLLEGAGFRRTEHVTGDGFPLYCYSPGAGGRSEVQAELAD